MEEQQNLTEENMAEERGIFHNKWYFIPDEARLNKIKVEDRKKRLEELERTLTEQGKRKRKAQYSGPPETKKGK